MNQIVYVVAIALLAGGCINAGYNYEVKVSHVDGKLPEKESGIRLANNPGFGYWNIGAMTAIERLAKGKCPAALPVEVAVTHVENSNESPLWARIPSYLTLTILPLYATQRRTYNVELRFPDGEATLEVRIKGYGFVSFFPTGLLPIPGRFRNRAWSAGSRALIGGDCGMMIFVKMAIEESTYEWLKATVGDAAESEKDQN